ncbi:hypothetical protein TIFTF001_051340, partial [Ficus carica]
MARSLISPPWSGNLWSSVSAGADFILGPARALPILVGAWSWDLTPWSDNHRSLVFAGQQAWYPGKFYLGHGEVLPGSTSMVPGEVLPGSR